jgi:aminomethyltransferase
MALRRTPFFDKHLAAGGRMVPFAGFEMPVQYSGVKPEHLAVRNGVGVFDVSHMGEFRCRGPRAEEALLRLLSNAVKRVKVGHAQYNVLCNERGGAVDDLYIYRLAIDDFLVCVNAANVAKDFAWMVEHNPCPNDATFTNHSDEWALLAIQGPKALALVKELAAEDLTHLGRKQVIRTSFAGVDGALVARTGYTGEDGCEVFLPAKTGVEGVWDMVVEAGAVPCGLGARDTLRLEAGNALYGHELDEDTSPIAAGLGWVVKLKKPGGFLGRDALASRRDTDPRVLVPMIIDGKRIAREGMRVLRDGNDVGMVTSGTKAPYLEKAILLAYVDRGLANIGERFDIDVRGRMATAEIVKGPFYKRDNA